MQTKTTTLKLRYSTITNIDNDPAWMHDVDGTYPTDGEVVTVVEVTHWKRNGERVETYALRRRPTTSAAWTWDNVHYNPLGKYRVIGGSSTHIHLRQVPAEPEA